MMFILWMINGVEEHKAKALSTHGTHTHTYRRSVRWGINPPITTPQNVNIPPNKSFQVGVSPFILQTSQVDYKLGSSPSSSSENYNTILQQGIPPPKQSFIIIYAVSKLQLC